MFGTYNHVGSQYTIPAMKLSSDALRTTLALKSKYITEVGDKVVKPLEDFLKNDLKDFKESKKTFDKTLEKYESTLAKYNGQNRQKEPSALREEAFQLYDTRKAYIQAAMSCSMLCIKFQDALDQLVLGVVCYVSYCHVFVLLSLIPFIFVNLVKNQYALT